MSEPIIEVDGLTKRFGAFTAVDRLSLSVPVGSIFAFLGANGSGKSTTIRMLIGLLRPTEGSIVVDGVDVIRHPRRVRDRIGYMGQRVSLYQGLSLRENVDFYGGLYGLEPAALGRRWDQLAERFALADAAGDRAEELPAGIRQRAGLALSMLHGPRLLFLDEPTAGVDVRSRSLFWAAIQDEARQGVSVFVTTHFLEEVDACDHVCFIDAGRVVAEGTPDELRVRWGAAYRIEVEPAPERSSRVRELLVAGGLPPAPAGRGWVVDVPLLEPAHLDVLQRLAEDAPRARVQVHEIQIAEVFRRVLGAGETAR
jgi:ABC-2 type transport system ATP-binding protein